MTPEEFVQAVKIAMEVVEIDKKYHNRLLRPDPEEYRRNGMLGALRGLLK